MEQSFWLWCEKLQRFVQSSSTFRRCQTTSQLRQCLSNAGVKAAEECGKTRHVHLIKGQSMHVVHNRSDVKSALFSLLALTFINTYSLPGAGQCKHTFTCKWRVYLILRDYTNGWGREVMDMSSCSLSSARPHLILSTGGVGCVKNTTLSKCLVLFLIFSLYTFSCSAENKEWSEVNQK